MLLFVDSQYASPYAMSAFVALTTKGCSFQIKTLDLAAGQTTAPEYVARSLTSRVPTLVDGDFALSESSAIAEYIDEAVVGGSRLYPTDIRARARARQVQAWLRSDLLALRQERSTEVLFYRPNKTPLSPAATAAAEKLLRAAENLLGDGREFVCRTWSIADVDLALMLNRLVLNGDAVPEGLVRYAKRQWAFPAVQAWLRMPRPPL